MVLSKVDLMGIPGEIKQQHHPYMRLRCGHVSLEEIAEDISVL